MPHEIGGFLYWSQFRPTDRSMESVQYWLPIDSGIVRPRCDGIDCFHKPHIKERKVTVLTFALVLQPCVALMVSNSSMNDRAHCIVYEHDLTFSLRRNLSPSSDRTRKSQSVYCMSLVSNEAEC